MVRHRLAPAVLLAVILAACQETPVRARSGAVPVPAPAIAAPVEAEPWDELPARPADLVAEVTAGEPVPPLVADRTLAGRSEPPPGYPRASAPLRARQEALAGLVAEGREPAARTLLAAWLPGATLAELAQLGRAPEPGLAGLIVAEVRRRLRAAAWSWEAVNPVLPLLAHPSEPVRAGLLAVIAGAAADLPADQLTGRLEFHVLVFRRLAADPSPWVRAEAIELLGRLRDRVSFERFLAAARDPWPVVRVAAARAIRDAITLVPGAPTTRSVCALLDDASSAVRAAALEVLAGPVFPCGLAPLLLRLDDEATVRLPLITDASGAVGVRLAPAETVRELALAALPPALRASAPPGVPLDLQVAAVRSAARRLDPAVPLGRVPALRPRPPARAAAAAPPRDLAAEVDRLAVAARTGDPAALRRALVLPSGRAALALAVPTLPVNALHPVLSAAREVPVRGVLASALLGLLAHPAARVRRSALGALGQTLADDRRAALHEAALWLARRDPDAAVRRVALAVLAAGRTGAPVQARLLHALGDPDPSVRVAAIPLALGRAADAAGEHLLRRLPDETPAVRAATFSALLRPGLPGLPVAVVSAGLADLRPVPAPADRDPDEPAPPHAGDRTVQEAVLAALEARLGVRHQGPPGRRAERWQDDLHRYGWSLPVRPE